MIMFPGVAERYQQCAEWHNKMHSVSPHYGLFWNLCINACFPGQPRIHTIPHADSKNIIGVCALFIYLLPGDLSFLHLGLSLCLILIKAIFADTQFTWLVIWEAGVAIQHPPWTILMYPSALFLHSNIDVNSMCASLCIQSY